MLGIMDAGNWQSLIDMKTGRQVESSGNDFAEIRALARNWPYPGDLSDESIGWVTGAAQAIVDMHRPDWMFLSYVQPYFIELFSPEDKVLSQQRQARILDDIRSFADRNGFEPLIVVTSEYVPLKGFITQPETKGVLESWPWGFAMAGISGAAAEDEEILNSHPLIQHVIPKSRVLASYPDLRPNFKDYFPDYVVTAQEGYVFRGLNYHHGQLHMADTYAPTLPVFSAIGRPQHVRDIRGLMARALDAGKKVLLVVIEGCRKGACRQSSRNAAIWMIGIRTGVCSYITSCTPACRFIRRIIRRFSTDPGSRATPSIRFRGLPMPTGRLPSAPDREFVRQR